MAYLAAALGGALGALARWGVTRALPHEPGGWPWSTLVVNLLGCALIGLLLAVLLARYPTHPWARPFLAVGVLGGFTTFSTFAVDVVQLADAGAWPAAVGYLLASVLGGLLAVVAGLGAGRRVVGRVSLSPAPAPAPAPATDPDGAR
ncbi:fluoride efflux transporter CrcB [Modestobacter sp. I12A-02628]|uniref:Fluoride-specific ion channel FluC n=2 Tax=Goekera deserti TaxID=2497753 RepID=A0A7K3WJK3_9ACTN|nr:fluoride efflux transporter CrcB [Goekera deserti]NDI50384.1 fluoride efflux transporter CrcB [Goekera deserti]NEL56671.1 fluoride efflux transporter CrcB [Goekera deserti]